MRTPRPQVIEIISDLKRSALFNVVHVDADLDGEAFELLVARPDKRWSLVDCSSFVLMDLPEALTTDHHFEQAGFIRLLK